MGEGQAVDSVRVNGRALRRLRESKDITLRTLAARAGVTYGAINRLETGSPGIGTKAGTAEAIAVALGCEVADFRFDEALCWCCGGWGLTVPAVTATGTCQRCADSSPSACRNRHLNEVPDA